MIEIDPSPAGTQAAAVARVGGAEVPITDSPSTGKSSIPSARIWALAVVGAGAMFVWVYAPNFRDLVRTWNRDLNYSHGFLVAPVALVILWRRWVGAERPRWVPWHWGWPARSGDPDRPGVLLRVWRPVARDGHVPARDRLPDADARRLAAPAPDLAGDRVPGVPVALAGEIQ